jgi:curved DNA-binding protein CbpA
MASIGSDGTYHAILGVSSTAVPQEIKAAYKKQALQMHPYKNLGDPNATKEFKKLGHAYEVLSDAQKIAAYDASHGLGRASQTARQTSHPNSKFSTANAPPGASLGGSEAERQEREKKAREEREKKARQERRERDQQRRASKAQSRHQQQQEARERNRQEFERSRRELQQLERRKRMEQQCALQQFWNGSHDNHETYLKYNYTRIWRVGKGRGGIYGPHMLALEGSRPRHASG